MRPYAYFLSDLVSRHHRARHHDSRPRMGTLHGRQALRRSRGRLFSRLRHAPLWREAWRHRLPRQRASLRRLRPHGRRQSRRRTHRRRLRIPLASALAARADRSRRARHELRPRASPLVGHLLEARHSVAGLRTSERGRSSCAAEHAGHRSAGRRSHHRLERRTHADVGKSVRGTSQGQAGKFDCHHRAAQRRQPNAHSRFSRKADLAG